MSHRDGERSRKNALACAGTRNADFIPDLHDDLVFADPDLRKALTPYIKAGRPLRISRGARVKRTQVGADVRTIKEWARTNGYEVNGRGRIPNDIREAFDAAN